MTSTMADPMTNTDRIEKKVFLRAPQNFLFDTIGVGHWVCHGAGHICNLRVAYILTAGSNSCNPQVASHYSAQDNRYFSDTPKRPVASSRRNSHANCRHCWPPGPTELSL